MKAAAIAGARAILPLALLLVLQTISTAAAIGSAAAPPGPAGASLAPADTSRPRGPGGLLFEPYLLQSFDGVDHEVELGRLWVPESRDRDTTHLVRLAFLRLRSTAEKPGSPIVFLAGGPGVPGSVMGRVPVYWRLFDRLREQGDVILLDQRGTGMTSPALSCSIGVALMGDVFVSESLAVAAMVPLIGACAAQWRARGVALDAYNTVESADDVEDLRRALKEERVRLLGMSYGTELALAAIRRHGSRIERAVLAGVRGPDQALKLPGTLDLQLHRLSAVVARDSLYGRLIPDLNALVRGLLAALDRKQVWLNSTGEKRGARQRIRIGAAGLQAILQGDVSDGRAMASVPAMLHSMSLGDLDLFLARLERLYNSMGSGISAMSIAMNCASGWSPDRLAQVIREAERSPFGNVRNLYMRPELCETIRGRDLGERYRSRIYSSVPALFLSGSLDATTPAFHGEEVRWGFPNGTHLVIENGWHETLPAPEVQEIVAAFLRGEEVAGRRVVLPPPQFLTVEAAKRARP